MRKGRPRTDCRYDPRPYPPRNRSIASKTLSPQGAEVNALQLAQARRRAECPLKVGSRLRQVAAVRFGMRAYKCVHGSDLTRITRQLPGISAAEWQDSRFGLNNYKRS